MLFPDSNNLGLSQVATNPLGVGCFERTKKEGRNTYQGLALGSLGFWVLSCSLRHDSSFRPTDLLFHYLVYLDGVVTMPIE